MRPATKLEILHTLHTLWKKGQIDASQVKHLIYTSCFLELTILVNGEIKAQSPDGKVKYSIK